MDQSQRLAIYRAMVTAREIDRAEQELTNRGEASFHVPGAGHEATAALAPHLTPADWLHCHYRDKALLLARGLSVRTFFDNLLTKRQSSSQGRRMSAFFSDPRRNVLSMTTPTGNNALQAVGVAEAVKDQPRQPVVLCSVGDGTTQQGEFLEAVGEAVRRIAPVLFLVEDNHWAISTTTLGRTFYSLPAGRASEFYGLAVRWIDGRDAAAAFEEFGHIVRGLRHDRNPRLVVMDVERLASHTNADDQRVYRKEEEIRQAAATGDPIVRLEERLLADGYPWSVLERIRREAAAEVAEAAELALQGPDPEPVDTAKRPIRVELTHPSREVRGDEGNANLIGRATLTMREALGAVLRHHLQTDERVFLYGEDIEDPKGDVFGVTKGLSTQFPGRVRNAALSESTIVGTCIGRALAGQRPVGFIQFADFLPLAFNQIACELGSMFWRSGGGWEAPVILMVACGGYRPGLGPYHAQTLESMMAHTPGVDVFMPSTACDAAGLLNAAFLSQRPTLFLYPKSLLNDPARATSPEVATQFVPIGVARKVRAGRDITFVGWGNTVALCQQAADALEKAGAESDVIDLRSISPWDEQAVLTSVAKTARLVVVHEDNQTCGLGGEILATVAEKTRVPVAMRRVVRPDTYIPCNYANQLEIMPSFKRVLATAAELLDFDLSWKEPKEPDGDVFELVAIGSGPSDETVTVVELLVQAGGTIQRGQAVASVEASKSVFEITSAVSGTLCEILVGEGDTVAVGKPLMRVLPDQPIPRRKRLAGKEPGEPVLVRRAHRETLPLPRRFSKHRAYDVGLSLIHATPGSRVVSNSELLDRGSGMTADDILRLTGIESRHWVNEQETAVGMAVRACRHLLEREHLAVDDLDLMICSTTSPTSVTPSMACQVLNGLTRGKAGPALQAYDINAACSGYLYALQAGYDYLQSMPTGRVMVVTAEVLSPLLDPNDLDTAILFGDAASATILYGESRFEQARGRLYRPELSAKGEDGSSLSVPFRHGGYIQMKGRKVFSEAVRSMVSSLNRVCHREGIGVRDLRLIVPHQANQRIIDAIQSRVDAKVFSNIRRHGNTSSSSIPLCLSEVFPTLQTGDRLGVCAFGGGFTFGASILQAV